MQKRIAPIFAFLLILCFGLFFLAGYGFSFYKAKQIDEEKFAEEGWRKYWQGDYDGAMQEFKENIKGDKDDYYKLIGMGWVFYDTKEYGNAVDYFERAVSVLPNDGLAYEGLGWTYFMEKEFMSAIGAFERSLIINPYDYSSHYGLAISHHLLADSMRQTDKKTAIVHYTKATEGFTTALHYKPNDALSYYWISRAQYELFLIGNGEITLLETAKQNIEKSKAAKLTDQNSLLSDYIDKVLDRERKKALYAQ